MPEGVIGVMGGIALSIVAAFALFWAVGWLIDHTGPNGGDQ